MTDQIIKWLTAEMAKEKGYKDIYFKVNNGEPIITEPTQSLLQKWLREKHKIYVTVNTEIHTLKHGYEVFVYRGEDLEPIILGYTENSDEWDFDTYEDALESALRLALQQID